MNGAQALIRTLVDAGVDVCFANPGTSEMHFVAALDSVPEMRGVLALFEGVATGAADGYARMTDRPAAVLLHLGPGLANGLANLHNARRAATPVLAVVGDHATYHKHLDAPLESDIDALAGTVSGWVRRTARTEDVATDALEAVAAASGPPGRVATLMLPADVSWGEGAQPAPATGRRAPSAPAVSGEPVSDDAVSDDAVSDDAVAAAAKALTSGARSVLLIGGDATRERGLRAAARIAAATGATPLCETFPTRLERGAGLPVIGRLGYLAEMATYQLGEAKHLVLAGARAPVTFFGYPGKPSELTPQGCEVHELAGHSGATAALEALADLVAPDTAAPVAEPRRPERPTGELTAETAAAAIGALMPEHAVVVDESNTSGMFLNAATEGAPRHDWLTLTGGAIGYGLPAATGAAIAVPDRPVLCLQADGSAMYTISALWTHTRENLDITTVIYNNSAYAILRLELQKVGVEAAAGPKAAALLDLSAPTIDFVALATGMGVPARRAETADELVAALEWALSEPGPHLIDTIVAPLL